MACPVDSEPIPDLQEDETEEPEVSSYLLNTCLALFFDRLRYK